MAFKTIVKTAATFVLTLAAAFGELASKTPPSPSYKIGIIQTIEHPALDETRRGIQDELTQLGLNDRLQTTWDSAQGNPTLATQIAQKYTGQQVNLIVAIGTTAAQAALGATRDNKIPVVFASVTDPKSAKLVGNITGVSNFVAPKDQFAVMVKMIPGKKRIGVIYNPGEANSASLIDQMQADAKALGLEIVLATASKTSEVASAAQGLVGKVDIIFINNDNTALAAIQGIGQICRDNNIILIASDGDLKESGAAALIGADQYKIGRQAGSMVAKILTQETQASDIPIEYPKEVKVDVNDKVAGDLGITAPSPLNANGRARA